LSTVTILTGVLRSKIEWVYTKSDTRYSREADAGDDETDGKRHVTADVASRYQTTSRYNTP